MNDQQYYLTADRIENFVKEKEIFARDAVLTVEDMRRVKESVEGFVNLIYRIRDDRGKSVVLKQVLNIPYFRQLAEEDGSAAYEDISMETARLRSEISVLIFWNTLFPGIAPDIYLFDEERDIIIMEDLSRLGLLRYELCRMKRFPHVGERLGRFFARNLFFSSDLTLSSYKKIRMEETFSNPEYTTLYEFLFTKCNISSLDHDIPEETLPLRKRLMADDVVQKEIRRLGDKFLQERECLIHTDLHSSNIMVDTTHLCIIDTEFAGYGPICQDIGRILGSYLLNFFSWYGDDTVPEIEAAYYRNHLLDTVESLFEHFEKEFRALCLYYEDVNYTLRRMDIDAYLFRQFQDALASTAVNTVSRISGMGLSYDLQRLPEKNRLYPIFLILELTEQLLKNYRNLNTPADFTRFLRLFAHQHPKSKYNL